MGKDAVLAKDITDCDGCPLNVDCSGGWVTGNGRLIEPPCCNWNGDEKIYAGMYDHIEYTKYDAVDEKNRQQEIHNKEIEELKESYLKMTGHTYKHIELDHGDLCSVWKCPYCNTWRHVISESWHNGFGEAWCSKCNKTMIYCAELEKEM